MKTLSYYLPIRLKPSQHSQDNIIKDLRKQLHNIESQLTQAKQERIYFLRELIALRGKYHNDHAHWTAKNQRLRNLLQKAKTRA